MLIRSDQLNYYISTDIKTLRYRKQTIQNKKQKNLRYNKLKNPKSPPDIQTSNYIKKH